ncbi:MAG: hypothetical protein ACXU85_17750, partial [Xanthobacteraceae bacterium]
MAFSMAARAILSIWSSAALASWVADACCCPPRLICSTAVMICAAEPDSSCTAVDSCSAADARWSARPSAFERAPRSLAMAANDCVALW